MAGKSRAGTKRPAGEDDATHLGVEILEPQTRAQRQTIGDMPRVLHVEPEVGIQLVDVERRRVEDLHRVRDTVSIALVEIGVDGGIVLTEFPEPPLPARFDVCEPATYVTDEVTKR